MNISTTLALLVAAASPAIASDIDAWTQSTGTGLEIRANVSGTPGTAFAIFSTLDPNAPFDLSAATFVARGLMDPTGTASVVRYVANPSALPANFGVQLHLVMREPGGLSTTGAWLPVQGGGGTLCQTFDPNFKIGPVDPVAGEFLTNQWDIVNCAISGVGNNGPDAVIVFDSANPTGNDTDLVTPGYGPGNNTPLGNLLILPGDVVDMNMDGLVDDPCDNPDGGVMRFDFAEPYRMCSASIVDIDDDGPSELRFYIGAAMTLETIPLMNLGDNSVQTLTFDKRDVRRFELALAGSGALARLEMVPCPLLVNLDESPFGRPRMDQAGEQLSNQYSDLGLTISGQNNTPGNPDTLCLFDSENPTGGDFDLMTPGPGIGNDTPLGLVIIIAENDIDLDMNGLIDDPDDEAGGGQMLFEFSEDVTFFSASALDVDGVERDVFTFFDMNGVVLDTLEINALGDNSVQQLLPAAPIENVRSIQVNLVGSGALTRLRWCPSSNFGVPLN